MTTPTTPTSGAADLPEALRIAALLEKTGAQGSLRDEAAAELRRLYAESEMRRAALLDEMQKAAQPAAQQGVAYAALPEFDSLDDDLIDAACSAGGLYRVDLMRAWNVLREARASHGQAPAAPTTQPAPAAQPAPQQEPHWWRKRADKIELQVALSGSSEAMRCYTDMRTLLQAAAAQADSVREDAFKLLNEVAQCFTADDDLPDNLLPRIDAVIAAIAAQEGKSHDN